tara:strand:- start:423 stop:2009 length:1587 start_codon:yes stop_codon:yes gene_type:complete
MEMFNEGKISLRDLTDDQGKVRTLRDLMKPLSASDGLPYAMARKPVIAEVYDSFRRNILKESGVSLDDVRPTGKLPPPVITRPDSRPDIEKTPITLEREHIEKTKVTGFSEKYLSSEGINETQLLTNDFEMVFKPVSGEAPIPRIGIPQGTYYRREVASSIIDEELGLGLVPTTGIKTIVDKKLTSSLKDIQNNLKLKIKDQERLRKRKKLANSKNGQQKLFDAGAIPENTKKALADYKRELADELRIDALIIKELREEAKKAKNPNIGSAQKFMPDFDEVRDNPPSPENNWLEKIDRNKLEGMNLFDYIIYSTDRHAGNWMVKTKSSIVDIDSNLALDKKQLKKVWDYDDWMGQKHEYLENGIDPYDRIYDKVPGLKGKTIFGGDYDEYLSEQGLKRNFEDVDIILIDNGLSLPSIPSNQLVRDPNIVRMFKEKEISPYWMNKLENFAKRKKQIRSRLEPLELDIDSDGQGRAIDLMFDRVEELIKAKKHIDTSKIDIGELHQFDWEPTETSIFYSDDFQGSHVGLG